MKLGKELVAEHVDFMTAHAMMRYIDKHGGESWEVEHRLECDNPNCIRSEYEVWRVVELPESDSVTSRMPDHRDLEVY